MNTYADDLAQLFEKLDLKDAIMIEHSTGGDEVARYIGRHGTKRVAKAILVSAVPPIMLKTPANPGGLPIEVFDGLRKALADNRESIQSCGVHYDANVTASSSFAGRKPEWR